MEFEERAHTVMREVLIELDHAVESNSPQHSLHEGYAVILEEMDELWEEVKTNPRKNPVRRRRQNSNDEAARDVSLLYNNALFLA